VGTARGMAFFGFEVLLRRAHWRCHGGQKREKPASTIEAVSGASPQQFEHATEAERYSDQRTPNNGWKADNTGLEAAPSNKNSVGRE